MKRKKEERGLEHPKFGGEEREGRNNKGDWEVIAYEIEKQNNVVFSIEREESVLRRKQWSTLPNA